MNSQNTCFIVHSVLHCTLNNLKEDPANSYNGKLDFHLNNANDHDGIQLLSESKSLE